MGPAMTSAAGASRPSLPGPLHERCVDIAIELFVSRPRVDGVLLVGSGARGKALADIDLLVLVRARGTASRTGARRVVRYVPPAAERGMECPLRALDHGPGEVSDRVRQVDRGAGRGDPRPAAHVRGSAAQPGPS